jgi:uncharacterized integral membrane protein
MADKLPDKREEEKGLGRMLAALALGVYVVIFAVLNFDRVEVNWVFFSRDSRLIYVIIVSAVLGALGDRLLQRRSHKER